MTRPVSALRPGMELELTLDGLVAGGEAIARHEGLPIFVPGGLPGDRVRARVLSTKPGYARALIQDLLAPGPGRIPAPCPHFGVCGGCQWQELGYPEQLEAKRALVREALRRTGGLELGEQLLPTVGMTEPWHYRNKAHWAIAMDQGQLRLGLYEARSHRVVDVASCGIQHPTLNLVLAFLRETLPAMGWSVYDETTRAGLLRSVFAKVGHHTGELMVGLVTTEPELPGAGDWVERVRAALPATTALVQNVHPRPGNALLGAETRVLAGAPHLLERIGALTFAIQARSFFQVNPFQVERLYELAVGDLGVRPGEHVVDAYSGTGTLALFAAAAGAGQVVGIECVAEATADAAANAARNGLTGVRWVTARVEEVLEGLVASDPLLTAALLDPPRKGCEPQVLEAVIRSGIQRLVYVSCDPVTLARDLKHLVAGGFQLLRARPVDMFPQTAHVETVALLQRTP